MTALDNVWAVTRVIGLTLVSGTYEPAASILVTFDQDMTTFNRKKVGNWWECEEEWAWRVSDGVTSASA